MEDENLTTAQVAQEVNIPEATLRWWRHTGTGPRAFIVGQRKVMYRRSDLRTWLDAQYAASATRA